MNSVPDELCRSLEDVRLAALAQALPGLAYTLSSDWTEMCMLKPGARIGEDAGGGLFGAIPPDEHEQVAAALRHAQQTGQAAELEHRFQHADGGAGCYRSRMVPVTDNDGRIVEWLGASCAISAERRSSAEPQVPLSELQRRVRNILAVVRSVVRRSADASLAADDYVRHLDGRLSALARAQGALTRSVDAGMDLEDLLRSELLVQVANEERFDLTGPAVLLAPKAAEVLTLAIHELATNATKFGALSRHGGKLVVSWHREPRAEADWLILCWGESGVPVLEAAPRREGFGTELVTRRIAYELKGEGVMNLIPGGVACRIAFPLVAGETVLAGAGPPV